MGDLVDAIEKSAKRGRGVALSGGPKQRLGVRSDIVFTAKRRVLADRAHKLGTTLSDNFTVTPADYSDRLTGLLILMTSYMLCGEMLDGDDYELFAKSYLPINVNTPILAPVQARALGPGAGGLQGALFPEPRELFRAGEGRRDIGRREHRVVSPEGRGPDLDRFHATRLTWGLLLRNTVNGWPLKVTKDNSVKKKSHKKGDEVLFAPISSIIPFARPGPAWRLELRRIGFAAHHVSFFEPLMKTVRALTRQLNS